MFGHKVKTLQELECATAEYTQLAEEIQAGQCSPFCYGLCNHRRLADDAQAPEPLLHDKITGFAEDLKGDVSFSFFR